jgi:phosphoglycolate phosphatase-like HAD superfamily hydrolase
VADTDAFEGGGWRESNADRPRFDLLWTKRQPYEEQMLTRDAAWFAYGASKYGDRNWEQFRTPEALARCQASLGRHYALFSVGDRTEDHAAAIRANVHFIEFIEWAMDNPEALED